MAKTKKMKNKDYFHLAKQSLKSRKKSTRTTVTGISFGLILILPVLYFTFAFFLDFNAKINTVPMVSMFNVETTIDKSTDFASSKENTAYIIRGTETVDKMLDTAKHKDIVYFNKYSFNMTHPGGNNEVTFAINNGTQMSLYDTFVKNNGFNSQDNSQNPGLFALDYDLSNGKFANDSIIYFIKDTHGKQLLSAGKDFSPETKGKGELLISASYAGQNSIHVGDSISMTYSGLINGLSSSKLDNDSDPNNYYDYGENLTDSTQYSLEFMNDFKVVGLIADEYYLSLSTQQDPHFFITTASYTNPDGTRIAPKSQMRTHTKTQSDGNTSVVNYALLTYDTDYYTLCERAAQNGQMAMLNGISTDIGDFNNYSPLAKTSGERLVRVQFDNYAQAQKANKILEGRMKALSDNSKDYNYSNTLFNSYQMMNMVGTIVVSVFLVFGGVILFATMINLYNSIQYSVESRRNYMGMLRAVGAKNNILHRMYFTEVILIFLKSLPWVAIFGGGISIGIKFAIDAMFKYIGMSLGMVLSLSLWYIPAVFAILFTFAFLVGITYSRICCKPLTKKGILALLKEDR